MSWATINGANERHRQRHYTDLGYFSTYIWSHDSWQLAEISLSLMTWQPRGMDVSRPVSFVDCDRRQYSSQSRVFVWSSNGILVFPLPGWAVNETFHKPLFRRTLLFNPKKKAYHIQVMLYQEYEDYVARSKVCADFLDAVKTKVCYTTSSAHTTKHITHAIFWNGRI